MTAPAKASTVAPDVIRLVIHEGRNRQVRRMCEAVGHPVAAWSGCASGRSPTSTLAPGEWRPLEPDEIRALERAAVARDTGSRPPGATS